MDTLFSNLLKPRILPRFRCKVKAYSKSLKFLPMLLTSNGWKVSTSALKHMPEKQIFSRYLYGSVQKNSMSNHIKNSEELVDVQKTIIENSKKKLEVRMRGKRKNSPLGWIFAGCCFSKKSKLNQVREDDGNGCTSVEKVSEGTSQEFSDIKNPLPITEENKRPDVLVHLAQKSESLDSDASDTKPLLEIKTILPETDAIEGQKKTQPDFNNIGPENDATTYQKNKCKGKKKKKTTKDDGEGKASKPRPNYFVAFQVDNPEIHNSLQRIQNILLEHKPLMKKALISLPTLHITFVVMHIDQQETLERAKEALVTSYNSVKEDLKRNPLHLTFEGLSSFRNKVLFANLKEDENLSRLLELYETIASCFEAEGFDVRERDTFTPHLTIAKLSKDPRLHRQGLKSISPSWYEDSVYDVFGSQHVKSLQLLNMTGPHDAEGYYENHKECFFDAPTSETSTSKMFVLAKSEAKKKQIRQKFHDVTASKLKENDAKNNSQ